MLADRRVVARHLVLFRWGLQGFGNPKGQPERERPWRWESMGRLEERTAKVTAIEVTSARLTSKL